MTSPADFLRELELLERLQSDAALIATRTDDARRHELIQIRRKLSEQIARVSETAEPIFGNAADAAVAQTYRDKFSRMRSAMAMLQTRWPAVRLGEAEADGEYQRSAQQVNDANRDFISWTRIALGRISTERYR